MEVNSNRMALEGRSLRRAAVVCLVCAAASVSIGAGSANAAQGDLLYQGCLTGDTNVGPAGSNACSLAGTPASGGVGSGLEGATAIAVSPDGASLYALSQGDDAISRFSRSPSTGALTFQDCITGATETGPMPGGNGACAVIPSHKPAGTNSGFDQPYGIVISSNGASVYVTGNSDDSVARFSRNTMTGALTYRECWTGETATGHIGVGNDSCFSTPSHTAGGDNSGLDKVRAIAIDPLGQTVYASSPADDSMARFTFAMNGALNYQDCLSAETPTTTTACTPLPGVSGVGANSGFDNPQSIAVSPNGASVYVASGNDASVTRFDRTAVSGVLSHQQCLTRDTDVVAPCTQIAGGTANGFDTGLDNLRAVAVSPNGASLYTIAGADDAVARFSRDTGTGALAFQDCLTADDEVGPPPSGNDNCLAGPAAGTVANGSNSGWDIDTGIAPALAISGDGAAVYFAAQEDYSVVQLNRNTTTGALSFRRCVSSETQSGANCALTSPNASGGGDTALDSVNSLALSADGLSLYTAARSSDAIARFGFEGPPAPPTGSAVSQEEAENPKCAKLRAKLKEAEKNRAKRRIRGKLRKLGCRVP